MIWPKLFLIGIVVSILGIPLNSLFHVCLLVLAAIYIAANPLSVSLKKGLVIFLSAIVVMLIKPYWPRAYIQEGHNVFLTSSKDSPLLTKYLPTEVYHVLKEKLDEAYPPEKQCSPQTERCWTRKVPVDEVYAFSADSFFKTPLYSRVVHAINFSSLETFRLGTVNDIVYNFYAQISGNIKRSNTPYFVRYDFPANTEGSELCWQGHLLWKAPHHEKFSLHSAPSFQCKIIEPNGGNAFAFSFEPTSPLKMSLDLPWGLKLSKTLEQLFIILVVFGILFATVKLNDFKKLFLPLLSVITTIVIILIIKKASLLNGYPVYQGGGDGLTHEGMGRLIAKALFEKNYLEALQGYESIFYFMPGLRYFRALEKILFGDTNYGYVLYICFFPLIIAAFLTCLFDKKWALRLFFIFLLTPIFERFGFAHYLYVQQVKHGHAEPLGYGLFLAAIVIILKNKDQMKAYFWAHFLFVFAIFMRPNLAIPIALFSSFTFFHMVRERSFKEVVLAYSSFGLFFLMTLHNWYFGGQFVLATSAAFIPMNLPAAPAMYWQGLLDLLQGHLQSSNLITIKEQLYSWNKWSDSYRLLSLGAVIYYAFKARFDYFLRAIAITTLGSHVMLLFFVNSGRYSYLAWFLSFSFLILYFKEKIVPLLKNSSFKSILKKTPAR
jgi:hypothetical protein